MIRSISVVIPNYNGRKLLEENIPFVIQALEKSNAEYEIIISDDASTDDSVIFIESKYPFITLIKNQINQGFAPTINKGISIAKRQLVLLLNSDVQLTGDYFTPQFRFFDNPDTFGVMGRIIGINNDKIQDAAKYPQLSLIKLKSTLNFYCTSVPKEFQTPSLFLSGANALVDRAKLFQLNGFDEVYRPFYNEDVDLSLRAWRMGWSCYYEHESICRHPNSVTIKNYHKETKVKSISRCNKMIMHYVHLSGVRRVLWHISILFELLFSWITFKPYFYKGFSLFLSKYSETKRTRENFKNLQEKNSVEISLEEVIIKIKNLISRQPIEKF